MERGHDMTKSQKGTLCVFAAALLYSIGGLCIKLIPWGGMAINGSRTAIALVVIGAYLIWVKHPLRLNRWVALGAISVFGCNALFSIANKLTTAANTIVLQFTAPIFVLLITLLFFHRRPDKLDVITCVVVFGGVVFFFLDSLEMGGGLGNVLALLSGLAYAGVFLLNDMPDSDAISSVFWGDVLSAITGLPFLVKETDFSPTAITGLLVLGVFQVAVAYILLTIGLNHPSCHCQLGLRHRAGAQPHPCGGILWGENGPHGTRWGGYRYWRRHRLQCLPGKKAKTRRNTSK